VTSPEIDVLLADDDAADAELILASLGTAAGDRVHVARDGEEALDFLFGRAAHAARASATLPRLVILDLKLPKVTGLEVLRQIKHDPRTRLVPVVLLTSSAIVRDVTLAYAFGANSYVQKPMDFDEFRQTVRRVGEYWLTVNAAFTGRPIR
jgi:two-component system, response regulator